MTPLAAGSWMGVRAPFQYGSTMRPSDPAGTAAAARARAAKALASSSGDVAVAAGEAGRDCGAGSGSSSDSSGAGGTAIPGGTPNWSTNHRVRLPAAAVEPPEKYV